MPTSTSRSTTYVLWYTLFIQLTRKRRPNTGISSLPLVRQKFRVEELTSGTVFAKDAIQQTNKGKLVNLTEANIRIEKHEI